MQQNYFINTTVTVAAKDFFLVVELRDKDPV